MTFRNYCLAPPNASNPSKPSPQRLLLRLRQSFMIFETAVWHPQTLPTLPKPRSASGPETARLFPKLVLGTSKRFQNLAAPQRLLRKAGHANSLLWPHFCFCGLPKLLFGTPKRFQPFQPFQNLAAPQRLLQRLRESFMTFRNCCLAPQPFQPFQNLAAPQRRCSALKGLL